MRIKFPEINDTCLLMIADDNAIKPPIEIKKETRRARRRHSGVIKNMRVVEKNIFGHKDTSKFNQIKRLSKSYKIYALGAGSLGQKFADMCDRKK